jgi:rhodanese-related sulfurtransferase
MSGQKKDGTAETLRGAVAIVVVGLALGLAFNALGLASKPPRGLSWIKRVEKMPSLEELQPGSRLVPAPAAGPGGAPRFAFVGTAWAQEAVVLAAAADTSHPGVKRAPAARKAPARKVPVTSVKRPVPVPKSVTRVPAAAPAAPPAAAKVDLPVVPDLDQPIEVKLAFAKRFFDAGPGAAVFVDAREASEYAEGHIAGALSVPFDDAVRNPALIAPFQKAGKPLILYCSGGDCELSKDLARNMLAEGIRKVLVFTDGLPAWKAAGYPMEAGAAKGAR